MDFQEMIDQLVGKGRVKDLNGDVILTTEEAEAITVALRAGQAMRDAFQVDYYASYTAFIATMDRDKLLEAGQAWDAATQKD